MAESIQEIDRNERKEKIKLLQKYLREIAKQDTRIPLLAIDGIFLDRTANAVSAFQEIYALPVNGEVDEQTWNRIYQEYIDIVGLERACACLDIFGFPDAALTLGESGYIVYFVQVMLLRISDKYSNFPKITVSGTVDQNTIDGLNEIIKISELSQNASDTAVLRETAAIYCNISKI